MSPSADPNESLRLAIAKRWKELEETQFDLKRKIDMPVTAEDVVHYLTGPERHALEHNRRFVDDSRRWARESFKSWTDYLRPAVWAKARQLRREAAMFDAKTPLLAAAVQAKSDQVRADGTVTNYSVKHQAYNDELKAKKAAVTAGFAALREIDRLRHEGELDPGTMPAIEALITRQDYATALDQARSVQQAKAAARPADPPRHARAPHAGLPRP